MVWTLRAYDQRAAAGVFGVVILLLLFAPVAEAQSVRSVSDARLARSVSLSHIGIPLATVLKELSDELDVSLIIRDPALERQQVYILAQNRPAGVLLNDLARTIGANWKTEDAGYGLVRAPTALDEARRYRRDQSRLKQAEAGILWKQYRRTVKLAVGNAEFPPAIVDGVPVRPFLSTASASLAPLVAELSDDQLRQLFLSGLAIFRVEPPGQFTGRPTGLGVSPFQKAPVLSIPASRLPAGARAALEAFLQQRLKGPQGRVQDLYRALVADPDPIVHFSNYHGSDLTVTLTSATADGWGPDLEVVSGTDSDTADPEFDPNRGLNQDDFEVLAKRIQRRRHAGSFPYQAGRVYGLREEEAQRRLVLDFQKKPFTDKQRTTLWLGEVLQLLHAAGGYTIIGDYFTRPFQLDRPTWHPEIGRFLNDVAVTFGRNVRVDGKALLLRSTTWPDDEVAEPSGELVRNCVKEKIEHGSLSAQTWLDLGRLPREQLAVLCLVSELTGIGLVEEANAALHGRPALELFYQLRPSQRRQAAESSITWKDLDIQQQRFTLAWGRQYEGPRVTSQSLARDFQLTLRSIPPVRPEDFAANQRITLASLGVLLPYGGRSATYRIRGTRPLTGELPQANSTPTR